MWKSVAYATWNIIYWTGNSEHYFNAENSDLNCLLDRGQLYLAEEKTQLLSKQETHC